MATAVGIDVSKVALDLTVDGVRGVVRFANTKAGIGKLLARLRKLEEPRIVLEATRKRGQVQFFTICEAKSPPLAGFLLALVDRINRSAAAGPYPASA